MVLQKCLKDVFKANLGVTTKSGLKSNSNKEEPEEFRWVWVIALTFMQHEVWFTRKGNVVKTDGEDSSKTHAYPKVRLR